MSSQIISLNIETTRAAARRYKERKWVSIAYAHGQKHATEPEWQKKTIDKVDIDKDFGGDKTNIGVVLGAASDNLVDVDLDCPEAIKLAPIFLPPTDKRFGRPSTPDAHWLYRADVPATVPYSTNDEKDGMLVELRSTGGQTMFPPSVHPSGERLAWAEDGALPDVNAEDLGVRVRRLAVAALILRHWTEGNRNPLSLRVIGALLTHGWTEDEVNYLLTAVSRHAGDDPAAEKKTLSRIKHTVKRIAEGRKHTGLPKLAESLNINQDKLREWIDMRPADERGVQTLKGSDELLAEMNAEYFVIDLGGKACVGAYRDDPMGRPIFSPYTFDNFQKLNDHIRVRDGEGKSIGKGSWYIRQPGRRQYDGVTFKAGPKGSVMDTGRMLNLWKGFGVEAIPGDWSLMSQHIHDVLLDGNAEHALYVIRWLAWAVQNPSTQAEAIVVLKSTEEGTGKGALGNNMCRIFGQHGRRIDRAKLLTGEFNQHLQNVSFLYCDEALWPGDRSNEGAFKGYATEPTLFVNPKGINQYEVPNVSHLLITSNNEWTVPAGNSARRLAVFRVSAKHLDDAAYFTALFDQMNNGGREAMLHDLLSMDLGDWHPRQGIPKTKELLAEKLHTFGSEMKWWFDIVAQGQLPSYPPLLPNECVTKYLFASYAAHAGTAGERYKSMETKIGQFLRKLMEEAGLTLKKDEVTIKVKGKSQRVMIYRLPELAECRRAIDVRLRQGFDWEAPMEWLMRTEDDDGSNVEMPF